MLASFRRHLNSWVARAFFLILVAVFVVWGVGDVIRNMGDQPGAVASVGGRQIQLADAQSLYQRELQQVTHTFGTTTDPTPAIRRAVAAQSIERLVTQAALEAEDDKLGIVVSDGAVRAAVFAIPQLQGPDGKFSHANLDNVLRNNNMTEQTFLGLMRSDVAQRQLVGAITAGVVAPETEVNAVFAFQNEKRVAQGVEIPFSKMPAPPPPTDAALQRWYDNHPEQYKTPEYRRVRAVVLSPETVAKEIQVTDAELQAAWEERKSEFQKPETRSVQVITAPDAQKAAALAQQWTAGADWAAMQKAAQAAGATPVEITDTTRDQLPSTDLAEAVFGAQQDAVTGPIKGALGYFVLRVTKIDPGASTTFEQAKAQLQDRIVADKAADLIEDRANKIDQLLTAGTPLDKLPDDLGLAALTGTLDAQGNTEAGSPAPIPGSAALKAALVAAAFQEKPGDPPHLVQAPQQEGAPPAYYAVEVETITPPQEKPFADVKDAVQAAWTQDAIRHEAEEEAAKMLTAVKGGQSLADAATVADLAVNSYPPIGRSQPADGVPEQLVQPLFGMKKGEATMIEVADGFVVAVLTGIDEPDRNTDPIGYGQIRDSLNQAVAQDVQEEFAIAVRNQAKPRINPNALDMIAQAGQ